MNRKLRIGVLINSLDIPAWVYQILIELKDSDYAELVLFIKNDAEINKQSRIKRLFNDRKKILYILYTKFDRKIFHSKNDANKLINIEKKFSSIPIVKVVPKQTKFSDYFSEDDIQKIKEYNLDVLIRSGFRILRKEILNVAKYGIWSYHHGDNNVNRGDPPGFWEVLNGWGETGSILQILSEDLDGGTVLYRSFSQTDTTSVNRNINQYYWKSTSFINRKLKELYFKGEKLFFEKVNRENQHPGFYSECLYKTPTNNKMLLLLIKHFSRYVKMKLNEIFYFGQWQLRYSIKNKNNISKSFYRFKKIVPPQNKYWADPFFIKKENKYYIFFEELYYANPKGHISMIELDHKGNYSDPKIILKKDYHLSFPFIFEINNTYYMIPESSENKTIELYKCVHFPDKWEFQKNLMTDVSAVDSNVFYYNNKWWLFTNIREKDGASLYDELFLFFSDSFDSSNWQPHPSNPIVSDVKTARPAGGIFIFNENLYRPGQNSKFRYGYGININHIVNLTETSYEEKLISKIKPNWDKEILSTHTLNYKDDFTIIDVLVKRRKIFR
jgi:hypothetical protein